MIFLNSLRIQARVIHALILRETRTRFDRNKLGYLWAVFEPITYIGVLIIVFSVTDRPSPISGEGALPMFFLSGMLPWLLFTHTVSKTMAGIPSNKNLLTYPQVTPFDVLLSRALLEFATLLVVLVVLLLIIAYFGYYQPVESYKEMILSLISIWLFALGLGYLNSSIRLYLASYTQTYQAIQRPFFFISGIFFTVESLPPSLRELALYNPLLHAIEWTRSATFTTYDSRYVDKSYLLAYAVVFLAIGLSSERMTRKLARQR